MIEIDDFFAFYQEMTEQEHTEDKLETLIEALEWAIEKQDIYYEFMVRFELSNTATFTGYYHLLFDHFFWCLDFFETNEEMMEEWVYEILWGHKWVLEKMPLFPHIEKEFIQKIFTSFKDKCEKYQYSLRPYHQYQHRYYRLMGEFEKAHEFLQMWLSAKRDNLSDCESCEKNQQMEFYFEAGEQERWQELGEKLLNSRTVCEDVPNLTYSKLLLPLYQSGEVEKAKEFQSEGYYYVMTKPHYLIEFSEHMVFLSLLGSKRAFQIYKKHEDFAHKNLDPHGQFYFYLATWFMILKYKEYGLTMPLEIEPYQEAVIAIAQDFDKCNGNDFYQMKIEYVLNLK